MEDSQDRVFVRHGELDLETKQLPLAEPGLTPAQRTKLDNALKLHEEWYLDLRIMEAVPSVLRYHSKGAFEQLWKKHEAYDLLKSINLPMTLRETVMEQHYKMNKGLWETVVRLKKWKEFK